MGVFCGEERAKGHNANDVALCVDDAEQVFDFMGADGSIMHVCFPCMLHSVPVSASMCFNVCVDWSWWQTVCCHFLLYRCVLPAVSAIIFITSVSGFPLLPTLRKRVVLCKSDQLVSMFTQVDSNALSFIL